jgi:(2R)-ethylmalonyl-CoA mutase
MDVVYDGIRLTPAEIVERAKDGVHCIGLSILSGSHLAMTLEVADGLREAGLGHIPIVVGGIIPDADATELRAKGIAAVYTPKDFAINRLIGDIVRLVDAQTP